MESNLFTSALAITKKRHETRERVLSSGQPSRFIVTSDWGFWNRKCLCHELCLRELRFQRQVDLPVDYKGMKLNCGYKIDLLVQDEVILELKAVEKLLPIHQAQLLTYLKLANKRVGLLINFNVPLLTQGIIRRVL